MTVIQKTALVLFALAALVAGMPATAEESVQAADTMAYHKQKVVYHINDAAGAGMALNNIRNHINAVGGGNIEVAVVTHGKGIDFLLDDWKDGAGKNYDVAVQELASQGVKFMICNNTLKGRNIGSDQVNMNASIVPSGVATVAELQTRGYVYIKP